MMCNVYRDKLSGQVAREIYGIEPETSDINTVRYMLAHTLYLVIKVISCFWLLGQVQMIDIMRERNSRLIGPSNEMMFLQTYFV